MHRLKALGFRFLFVYLLLYIPSFPLDLLPIVRSIIAVYDRVWFLVVPWIGRQAGFGAIVPGAHGDSPYYFVKMLCQLALAAVAALLWTAAARPKPEPTLHAWLRVAVRYALATAMFNYGVVKLFNTQFLWLGPEHLIARYGDSSPAELLWAYMAYSNAYTTFCGAAEVFGAILLFFRRTTTLGALVLSVVLVNIVMMNLCYHIGVLLFSIHLLVMALFLLAPDLRRLADVVVLNRPTEPVRPEPPLPARMVVGRLVAKTVFVGMVVVFMMGGALSLLLAARVAPPPLYGLYDVETFTSNDETRPPLLTDTTRWRWFMVGKYNRVIAESMDGKRRIFCSQNTSTARTLLLVDCEGAAPLGRITYVESAPDRLSVTGTIGNDRLSLQLRRVDESSFRLLRNTP